MNKKFLLSALLALAFIFAFALPVFAQDYSFQVPEVQVDLSPRIRRQRSHPVLLLISKTRPARTPSIIVDVGMPGSSTYNLSNVTANVDGKPITDIQKSPYVDGIALGLGSNADPGRRLRRRLYVY